MQHRERIENSAPSALQLLIDDIAYTDNMTPGAAILRLWEESHLELNALVSAYLPDDYIEVMQQGVAVLMPSRFANCSLTPAAPLTTPPTRRIASAP